MIRRATAPAALLVALVLGSCGSDDGKPIPSRNAARMESLLQQVQRQEDQGQCGQLRDTTQQLQREARRLPRSVSSDTRKTIRDGFAHLRDLAEDCRQDRPERDDTTTEETTTEDTAPTTTEETVPPTTETAPPTTETTPPTTDTTPTAPPETVPPIPDNGGTPPGDSDGGNGNGNGNGGVPPGQEKKGGKKGGKDK